MQFKLGDLVIKKDGSYRFPFQITGFVDQYVMLKGTKIPMMTTALPEQLIKLNRKRNTRTNSLMRVK